MASIHYYLTVFPSEALIASMLEPAEFGAYLATSSKRGSHERLMFIEIAKEFGTDFDWAYAKERCVPHKNGAIKHSVYLSVYRVLEKVPLDVMGNLYLVTSDGRSISLPKEVLTTEEQEQSKTPYYLYQELCPIQPLVVSAKAPAAFGDFIVSDSIKISLPALMYCDIRVIDVSEPCYTGNVGPMYDRNVRHLTECVKAVTERGKDTKTLERTFAGSFTFQSVKTGFAVVNRNSKIWYAMPSLEKLETIYYDWARSAMIL